MYNIKRFYLLIKHQCKYDKAVNNLVNNPIFQKLFMLIGRDYLVGYKKIPTFVPCKRT